ncbi:hypothetical protein [Streptomyces sp. NPDC052042]|uniref:hypothetical protein n=1 Tax=Streptomyces sp. NPDC052042 TaxID=3365683 RepID=UPI0037D512CC
MTEKTPGLPEATGPPEPPAPAGAPGAGGRRTAPRRKQMLLRLDPAVHDALSRWASDELRSANAHVEFLLRRALTEAGRLPGSARPIPRRGRPPKSPDPNPDPGPKQGQG